MFCVESLRNCSYLIALVKDGQEKTEEAKKILGELVFAEETTLANVEMAKFVLSSIVQRD